MAEASSAIAFVRLLRKVNIFKPLFRGNVNNCGTPQHTKQFNSIVFLGIVTLRI